MVTGSSVLGALFLSSLTASVICTVTVFVRPPARRHRRATSRPVTAVASLLPLATGPAALLLVHPTRPALVVTVGATLLADVAWLRLTRRWSWRGHAAWVATTLLAGSYLGYMLLASLTTPGRGVIGVLGSLVLWALELTALGMGTAFLWEVLDVAARTEWPRRLPEGRLDAPSHYPFVSLHVPAHNEPPDMVIDTLRSLQALDYPAYEIVMVDDNTDDPALWHPLRDYCAAGSIRFVHLEDWPGYKSGALNYVLQHATDDRAEVIGVIDADYIVDPDYLTRCATLFADRPDLGFVQTPQNYREWAQSSYYRRLFYSYEYFFAVSQASRNEVDGAIFGGTMGLIRRSALQQVGGWDEWCITEDAEVSLKMLRAGWSGQHVARPFGHGVMPLTFEALKRQRFRWCFGGMQILKAHWRSLMPWDRDPDNHLTQAQRWSYLAGALQWGGDLLGLAFATFLLLCGLDQALGGGLVLRRLATPLLVLPPFLIALGLFRALAALRLRSTASRRDALGALGLWLALSVTVAQATVRGLVQPEGVFLRTPKTKDQPSLTDAARANRVETGLGVLLLFVAAAALARVSTATTILAVLLLWHAAGLLAAPFNSLAAMRADLPPQLRRRRTTEWLRENVNRTIRPVPLLVALTGGTMAAIVAVIAFAPSITQAPPPASVLRQIQGQPSTGDRTGTQPDGTTPQRPSTSTTPPGPEATTSPVGKTGSFPSPARSPTAQPAASSPTLTSPGPAPTPPGPAPTSSPTAPGAPTPGQGPPGSTAPSITPSTPASARPSTPPTPSTRPTGAPTTRPSPRATPTGHRP